MVWDMAEVMVEDTTSYLAWDAGVVTGRLHPLPGVCQQHRRQLWPTRAAYSKKDSNCLPFTMGTLSVFRVTYADPVA